MNNKLILALILASPFALARAEGVRDYVHIVGSSTLQPFAAEVVERLAKGGKFKRPKLESTGTSGGFALFCEGVGGEFPDIVNASRPINRAEFESCQRHGVGDIVEVKAGYDGLVVASSKQAIPLNLTRKALYLALAKQTPDSACRASCEQKQPNPYLRWQQIDPSLPELKIEVLGTPFNSGISEIFDELVMQAGCNPPRLDKHCATFREDGVYAEETSDTILARLADHPGALGLLGYIKLREKGDGLQAASIEAIPPSRDSIATGRYPLAFPLYFYVKKEQVGRVPGLDKYLAEFTKETAWGENGYLANKGLIPPPADERKRCAADVKTLKPMAPP